MRRAKGRARNESGIIQDIVVVGLDGIWHTAIAEQVFVFLEAQAKKLGHFSPC
jgi:hypothetical protein